MLSLAAGGTDPFAAMVYRLIKHGITDTSLQTLSYLLGRLRMNSDRYKMTKFEGDLIGVMALPFGFRMHHGISVSYWSEFAKLSRDVVLAYLENGSETAPEYLAKKFEFDPVLEKERDRLLELPELGEARQAKKQFL